MRDKIIKIFKQAQREKRAIGQFNFSTISQFRGIVAAAKKLGQPIILGTSEGESSFLGFKTAVALRDIARENYKLDVILNLDHGKSFEYIKEAIKSGYDMVHFDGSSLSLKENIKETKRVVSFAKKRGVLVEGELGYIKGSSTFHQEKIEITQEEMTSPEDAKEFIDKTKVDFLAVAIGNAHGIYKEMPSLDQERLFMIKNRVSQRAFLVLHGGSGIQKKEIKKAIENGIVKININTETRIAWREGLEKALKKIKEVTPYKILSIPEKEVERVVKEKIILFLNK